MKENVLVLFLPSFHSDLPPLMQSFRKHASVWYPGPLTQVSPLPEDLDQQPALTLVNICVHSNFSFPVPRDYALGNEPINKQIMSAQGCYVNRIIIVIDSASSYRIF